MHEQPAVTEIELKERQQALAERQSGYLADMQTDAQLQPRSLEDIMKVSNMVSRAGICPKAFKNDPGSCALVIAAGIQLRVPWFAALQRAYVIEGKVGFESVLLEAVAKQSRRCKKLYLKESSPTHALMVVQTTDMDEPAEVSYTIEDATKAGLLKKGGAWNTDPESMCVARARSKAVMRYFPEAVVGIYPKEDLQDAEALGRFKEAKPAVHAGPVDTTGDPLADLASTSTGFEEPVDAEVIPERDEQGIAEDVEEAMGEPQPMWDDTRNMFGDPEPEPEPEVAPPPPPTPKVDPDLQAQRDGLVDVAKKVLGGRKGVILIEAYAKQTFSRPVAELTSKELDKVEDYVNEVAKLGS